MADKMSIPTEAAKLSESDIQEQKQQVEHYEVLQTRGHNPASKDRASLQQAAEVLPIDKRILWKLDILLIPVIAMLYLLVFIDRTNIGNARVAGLQKDLNLTDHQYKTGESTENGMIASQERSGPC